MKNDATGYKRGACGIDGRKGEGFLNHGSDDGNKSSHEVSYVMADVGVGYPAAFNSGQWKVGALPRGGEPRYAAKGDSGTKSPSAASPTGKYRRV